MIGLLRNNLYLLVGGLGVGWLIGLSVSPVVRNVITALLAAIVGVASVLAGIKEEETKDGSSDRRDSADQTPAGDRKGGLRAAIDPSPMASLIVGLVAGASVGVYARTHDWLGPDIARIAAQAQNAGLGKEDVQKIKRQLFLRYFAHTAADDVDTEKHPQSDSHSLGVLFGGAPANEYATLRKAKDEELYTLMVGSRNRRIQQFALRCGGKHPGCLRAAVEELIWPE